MMCTLQLFFLILFFFQFIHAAPNCPISMCSKDNTIVRFPFRLDGKQQPETCGYPGFTLRCNTQGLPVLTLPNSGDFLVRAINYGSQQIQLHDPDNCIPNRLLHFNPSGSPFTPMFLQNYTFLSCPSQQIDSSLTTIDCLGNSTNSVLATSSMGLISSLSAICQIMTTFIIPVSYQDKFNQRLTAELKDDLLLSWSSPDCEECEAMGTMCGFKGNSSLDTGCSYGSKPGFSGDLKVFLLLCFSFGLPLVAVSAGIICYAYYQNRRYGRNPAAAAAAVLPQPGIVTTGLDESTIESYEKLVLGDSKRIPGPNSGTCSICLSEYHSKETLRCIPECHHCFHAECIDEWLRMNGTCPVCRNSPSPARVFNTTAQP